MASSDCMLRLEGKVAIITGAASGIGEATARLFAAHGATVVIADVQDQLGEAVAASIGLHKSSYKHCNVTDEKQVDETVDYTVEKYGGLDIMHLAIQRGNSAHMLSTGMTPEEFENVCCEMALLKGVVLRGGHVAQVALFLASNASEYISGHDLVIDGGVTVVNRNNFLAK